MKTSIDTTNELSEDNRKHSPLYAKNSMDRFGDDLCEVLLSYFPLKDQFRYECVSKQFQRTVFKSVVDIIIDDNLMRVITAKYISERLITIAIKCPNIQTIYCRGMLSYSHCIPEVLKTFRDNCRHLREIYCDLWSNCEQWIHTFGPLVTRIKLYSINSRNSLNHCHRFSRLRVEQLFDSTSGQLLVKNLREFSFHIPYNCVDNHQLLSEFVAQNQSIKSIVVINISFNKTLNEMSAQLSRLTQLRELTFISVEFNDKSFNMFLRTIGQNCLQLQRLSLELLSYNPQLNNQTLDSLRYYSRLKRLRLLFHESIGQEVLEPLKLCHRLTHLTLYSDRMDTKWLFNCNKHWPRLQYLNITINTMIDECLDHISRLSALQTLVMQCHKDIDINNYDFSDMLLKTPKLKIKLNVK